MHNNPNWPWPVANRQFLLRSENIQLRDFLPTDITEEYVSWLNDPAVVAYSRQRFFRHSLESCSSFYESFSGGNNRFVAIDCLDRGRMIGTMTVYACQPHNTADVGILLGDPSSRGRGYGQQAWRLMLEWLLDECEVRKVTAGTLAINHAMVSLLDASIMHREAVLEKQELHNHVAIDVVKYAAFRFDQSAS